MIFLSNRFKFNISRCLKPKNCYTTQTINKSISIKHFIRFMRFETTTRNLQFNCLLEKLSDLDYFIIITQVNPSRVEWTQYTIWLRGMTAHWVQLGEPQLSRVELEAYNNSTFRINECRWRDSPTNHQINADYHPESVPQMQIDRSSQLTRYNCFISYHFIFTDYR